MEVNDLDFGIKNYLVIFEGKQYNYEILRPKVEQDKHRLYTKIYDNTCPVGLRLKDTKIRRNCDIFIKIKPT